MKYKLGRWYGRLLGLIMLLFVGVVLLASSQTVLAIDAVYAPSIFDHTPLESQVRTVVENMLFWHVMEDELKQVELTAKEVRLLEEKQQFSLQVIARVYGALASELVSELGSKVVASEDSQVLERMMELVREKEAAGVSNETRLLRFLVEQLQSQVGQLGGGSDQDLPTRWEIDLGGRPELDREEASYRFYQGFLAELKRLARLFPEIPSEIAPFDQREVLGFRFSKRQVVLTFDDGPSTVTPKFLATLKSTETPGVFFVQGSKFVKGGQVDQTKLGYISEAIELGADVGIHTLTHPNLIKVTEESQLRYELKRTKEVLAKELGYDAQFFRAPFGSRYEATLPYIYEEYLYHILWNIDSQDWRGEFTPEIMLERITRLVHLYNGGIVLFHDTNRKSAAVLPEVIGRLQECGFEFRTLSELLVGE